MKNKSLEQKLLVMLDLAIEISQQAKCTCSEERKVELDFYSRSSSIFHEEQCELRAARSVMGSLHELWSPIKNINSTVVTIRHRLEKKG